MTEQSKEKCPECGGKGQIWKTEGVSMMTIREIKVGCPACSGTGEAARTDEKTVVMPLCPKCAKPLKHHGTHNASGLPAYCCAACDYDQIGDGTVCKNCGFPLPTPPVLELDRKAQEFGMILPASPKGNATPALAGMERPKDLTSEQIEKWRNYANGSEKRRKEFDVLINMALRVAKGEN